MYWALVTIILMILVVITGTFAFFYLIYRLDKTSTLLDHKIQNVHAKYNLMIEALNKIHESEFKLDQNQQEQINELINK